MSTKMGKIKGGHLTKEYTNPLFHMKRDGNNLGLRRVPSLRIPRIKPQSGGDR